MKSVIAIMFLFSSLALTACESESVKVLKSPCASADGGPCGPKRTPIGNQQA